MLQQQRFAILKISLLFLLPQPTEILDALVSIGWRMHLFSDTRIPWTQRVI